MTTVSQEALTAADFTAEDLAGIRAMCIADTKGEETWHAYTLANGRKLDIDCYDEELISTEPTTHYCVTAYPWHDDRVDTSVSYELPHILYADMNTGRG